MGYIILLFLLGEQGERGSGSGSAKGNKDDRGIKKKKNIAKRIVIVLPTNN